MSLSLVVACLQICGASPVGASPASRERGTQASLFHLRLGLHASAHDLSPLMGVELSDKHAGIALDGWIRPFYWKTLEQQTATRWAQYRILYFGFNPSIFAILGDRQFGVVPMAGLELVTGDISGSSKRPKGEANPWAGLGIAFADHHRVDLRIAVKEEVLGWVRGEWTVVF